MFTLKNNSRGFTLIELLVVITIIGILATGGVGVFTQQIQKARDTTRITDLKGIESAIIQYNGDHNEYPGASAFTGSILAFMNGKLPKDPKDKATLVTCNTEAAPATPTAGLNDDSAAPKQQLCVYRYNVGTSISTHDSYKISAAFENSNNILNKGKTDGGNYNGLWEMYTGSGASSLAIGKELR